MQVFIRVALYVVSFLISLYGLDALHFEKLLKGNHIRQAQVLYFLMAMALAYLVSEFILGLMI